MFFQAVFEAKKKTFWVKRRANGRGKGKGKEAGVSEKDGTVKDSAIVSERNRKQKLSTSVNFSCCCGKKKKQGKNQIKAERKERFVLDRSLK